VIIKICSSQHTSKKIDPPFNKTLQKKRISFNYNNISLEGQIDSNVNVLNNRQNLLVGNVFNEDNLLMTLENISRDRIESYYGNFLHFHFSDDNIIQVYISQESVNKIFFVKTSTCFVLSDNVETILRDIPTSFQINWDYMITFLQRGNLNSIYSPFRDVFEIPPGCISIFNLTNLNHRIYNQWNPINIFTNFKTTEDWQELFLKRIKNTINQIIQNKKRIIIQLSGGLDSSLLCFLIASELKGKDNNFSAINFYNKDDPNSDERIFASQVANYLDVPISFLETSKCLPFSSSKFLIKPNQPTMTLNFLSQDRMIHEFLTSQENSEYTLISGHGGDSLFFSVPPIESIVDALIQHGYKFFVKKLEEFRELYPNPYFHDLWACIKILVRYILKKHLTLFDQNQRCRWIKNCQKINVYDFLHPFFNFSKNLAILPGKAVQMEYFYVTQASCIEQLPTLYPFFAQSILESAFSLPIYESFNREYSRILIRNILSNLSSASFAYRKSKGHATSSFFKGIQKNYNYILDLCMEGQFAQQNYIDKNTLYNEIRDIREGFTENAWYVTNLYCAELFLSEWV
jgi:asparagine synthase (glutamine-hydrolysing)